MGFEFKIKQIMEKPNTQRQSKAQNLETTQANQMKNKSFLLLCFQTVYET